MPTSYISVRTALYGFAPGRDDGHGRLEVRAGQTLLLLDTSDHEWWKFKIKTNRQHNDGDSGLVPKMLTKEAEFISSAIACRDFIARADGDLTIIEDESLSVYCVDGDWVLVKGTLGAGYVPKKCVELEQEINQTNDILQSQVPEPEEPDFPEEAASITPDHEEPHWWGGGDADSDHLINTMPQDQINISPRSNFGFGSTTAWYEPASQRSGMITSRSDASEVVALLAAHGCQDLTRALDYSSFSDFPVSGGGFGDVYQGRLLNGARIAVKAMRASTLSESPKHLKRAARELYTWSKLNHRNIVPLLGLAIFRDQIGMVSPWMMHGTLPQYLEKMPGVDRLDMCIQISEGLSYLHHYSIAHGSLKGANILVSDDGVPALADFGESSLRDHSLSFTQTGTGPSFTVRWTAPEMLEGSITQPSTASDVYALGMTIYETVTGAVPYHGKREHAAIYLVVVQKKHPERPKVMLNDKTSADELWNLLVMCWSPEPPVRPSVSDVLEALKRIQAISRLSRKMDATEIISHLVAHGWVDLSNRLNLASFSGPPASHDGLGDIYRGQLLDGATVAVKLHQISIDRNNLGSKNMQRAIRELYMWSKCRHPNAMPLLGLAAFQEQIGVVVPWANNESLPQYLNVVLGVNRYHMCIQICEGLSYLHQIGIIHRNLKASNILVSRDGIPLLFDLGSSWLTNQTMDSTQSVKYSPESLRWTAPEVITETTSYNKNSDVYALGMTLYEVMAGKVPYYEQSDATITLLVVQKKEPPERPESIPEGHETTDGFWELLLCCWSFEPTARPSAADVMEAIKTLQAAVVLSRKMAAQEVISHLIARGCPDVSNRLNIASFGDYPIFQGGFSDVYRGQLLDGITVAVKVLRVSIDTITLGSKHLKQAARELDTWNQCRHPNIMPLLGLAVFRERIGMVAPWMKNGNLPKYLGATPGVDLYNMCIQICEGLSHLHRIQIVHCDLKGANVLVSDEGAPLLTDFGTSLVSERTLRFTATTSGTSYTLRWSPAEILQETSGHTQASDIYALGMVIYEVMTGKVPFHGKQDPKVILQVTSGEIPERLQCMPTGDRRADALWGLLGRCWSYKPEARPTAGEVMEALREIAE